MYLEALAVTLSIAAIVGVATMFLLALSGIADPPGFVHCHDCGRWTTHAQSRPEPLCFRCRHGHHSRGAMHV